MTIFNDLAKARHEAVRDNKRPEKWRFSPEGWDKVRMAADMNVVGIGPDGQLRTVLGIPFIVDCSLPPETDFVLA